MVMSRRPDEIVASTPADHLVAEFVRHLADTVNGRVTYYTADESGRLRAVATWPDPGTAYADRAASEEERARATVAGGGVVVVAEPRRWGGRERTALRETAGWLGTVAQVELVRADRDRAEQRARVWQAELATARDRLAEVRELERRRLVRAITTTTLADLGAVRYRLRRLSESVVEDRPTETEGAVLAELAEVPEALETLLDRFRTVARGVYPAMLPDRGTQAALEELAATLRRPVRFRGDLGRRVEWHVEAGLYHAVATVLNTLAGGNSAEGDLMDVNSTSPIEVDFRRDEALRVRIDARADGFSVEQLRAILDYDAERLAVLGGAMDCTVDGNSIVVAIRLAERRVPVGTRHLPLRFEHNALYRSVWELVHHGQQVTGDGPDRLDWDALADRLTKPTRLVVVRDPAAEPVSPADVARAAALNVTVLDAEGPADAALAAEFLADDGPKGSIDAVLSLVPPTPVFRASLRQEPHRVLLSESADLMELARTLVARGPVIVARRVIVMARELVSRLPRQHPARWSLDRIAAESHEIAELDLLDELEHGDPHLLRSVGRGVTTEALRLLGACGTNPRARLGLPADTTDAEVYAATRQAVDRWRARAGRPATSGRDRAAFAVLVRTAEGLLNAVRNP